MPVPMICLDGGLRHSAAAFRGCFSKPQVQYFVTVLLALILCREHFTLSGLLRQVSSDSACRAPAASYQWLRGRLKAL